MEEEASKSIPHQNDVFRFGLDSVKTDNVASHPLQSVRKMNEVMKRQSTINLYGTAFPLKMDLDRFQRPPGAIPFSMLGLEASTRSLDRFSFEDYLNDPRESDTLRPLDMHHGMEVRLSLSKGPICPCFV